jgi:acyl dehydratase
MEPQVGQIAEHRFIVSPADMDAFRALSGDSSAVHTDVDFACSQGYQDVIVYGGIVLAKLSYVLGMKIPGDHGISTRWTIDYRNPLYVGQEAAIKLEVVSISESTGTIESKFAVRAADKLIATGKTQSILPLGPTASLGDSPPR